jgi:osmotically-inducible protein OsmY
MRISRRRKIRVIGAYFGVVVCGLIGVAAGVDAQNVPVRAVEATHDVDAANEALQKRVQAALHTDPYFYDRHVTVSVENGAVVLRGFVFSAWGLQDAIRIAKKAAGDTPVVDNLSIELGGGK